MQKSSFPYYYPDIVAHICVWILLRYRKYKYGWPFRKIKLSSGKFVIVDPEDFETLNQYNWYEKNNGYTYYAERKERIQDAGHRTQYTGHSRRNARKRTVRMHRQIMNLSPFDTAQGRPDKKVVDHINRHGWDNRKANLQVVSQQENTWNSLRGVGQGKSKYKGVGYSSSFLRCGEKTKRGSLRCGSDSNERKKWKATLCHKGKKIHLGYFENEIDAAKAYDEAAKLFRGRFAVLNFNDCSHSFDSAQDR
ncbi:MAG: HNH endonuclease [Sedimentisphaerales bacterium]|jgi:hypothetical protein